jgi:predicted acetyltransferase
LTPAVELAHDDGAVANLFVAYLYEMAVWDPGIVMNDAGLPVWSGFGLPGPRTLDGCARHNWWIRDRCVRYAIRCDGAAVGFAVICEDVTLLPYPLPEGTDWELLDFYVAPKARRGGIGAAAAREVVARHPGNGVLLTLAANVGAQRFWRATLAACAHDVKENADATEFRFRV